MEYDEKCDNTVLWFLPYKRYSAYCYALKIRQNEDDPCKFNMSHYLCENRLKNIADFTPLNDPDFNLFKSVDRPEIRVNSYSRLPSYTITNVTER